MKNIFLKSTLILMIGTLFTKLLSFIIRIIFTRVIGDGISIYSLVMPTQQLLLTITSLGLPYAISAVVAKNNYKSIHILSSIIPITILFNILIIIITLLTAPFISNVLLKNPDTYYPIISIVFILPFTSISGIIKGYYFGKQNMLPNAISSIFEQLTRLIIVIFILPLLIKKSLIYAISFFIAASALCELIQIIVYLFFMPKNIKFTLHDLKLRPKVANDILSLSIPTVSRTIIGNICYFFEPIILTNILLLVGYSNNYIITEYGIYNAYVIPILTAPVFIIQVLNTALVPDISKNFKNKNYIKKRLKQCLIFSLIIGILYCAFVFLNAEFILKLVYNTNKGLTYIKFLSIIFPIFFLEGPMFSCLIGLGLTKYSLYITIVSSVSKLIVLTILSLFSIGIYGLIISEIVNIFIVLFLNYKKLHKLKLV